MEKQLLPFKSDGCSAWPEGTKGKENLWIHCCFKHDIAYWLGGSEEARKSSDKEFKSCLKKLNKHAADVMYIGVRNFGSPYLDTNFKWGYGWTYERGYLTLNQRELSFAKKFLPKKGENMRNFLHLKKINEESKLPAIVLVQENFPLFQYDNNSSK